MSYAKQRYLVYILITTFTLVLPFITIDGNHMLLLSFDKLQFHFLGFVYNVNELYVMPFLLMFLFIGIFAMTTLFGRVWCGWACPQTIFRTIYRDLIENTVLDLGRIKNKQKDIDYSKISNKIKKYVSIFLWIIISIIISINFMWYFIPPEDFFFYMQDPANHMFMIAFILSTALFLVYDIVLMKENFCVYICPYSRIQSVLYDDDTKQIVYDTSRGGDVYVNREKSIFKMKEWTANEECTTCEACVKICPTNIDIRKGLQVECINCLECSDACTTVMGKLGKKSLINWGSTNSVINKKISTLLTKRNITYLFSLLLCVVLAGIFASKKEYFLLNINKTTKLYNIKEDAKVTNNYVLTFHNTQNKTYTYELSLEDNERFKIKRFKAFKLEPNKRIKKILIIETKKRLFLSDTKDTALKVRLIATAQEDKKITLQRELAFIYPRNDLVKD